MGGVKQFKIIKYNNISKEDILMNVCSEFREIDYFASRSSRHFVAQFGFRDRYLPYYAPISVIESLLPTRS